jgi:hypothetical protein
MHVKIRGYSITEIVSSINFDSKLSEFNTVMRVLSVPKLWRQSECFSYPAVALSYGGSYYFIVFVIC